MNQPLQAPFPYFGGKRKVAEVVWDRFGNVPNFVEPFFGSGAVLLLRPHQPQLETVNDLDGLVSNFWRALQADPESVAHYADWPVNENDLHARHSWLVQRKDALQSKLEGAPDFYDAKVAGWWCWGMCAWIGGGFCSGDGPWQTIDGKLVHLGDNGRGINRQLVHLTSNGQGINAARCAELYDYFELLAQRLKDVRVCCGDWSRVLGPSVTFTHGLTGVFLDPPYSEQAQRSERLYRKDCLRVAEAVRQWAIENGDNELLRIALCGYQGEHEMPDSWECFTWNAGAGYGGKADKQTGNGKKERIWFSPHCFKANRLQPELPL